MHRFIGPPRIPLWIGFICRHIQPGVNDRLNMWFHPRVSRLRVSLTDSNFEIQLRYYLASHLHSSETPFSPATTSDSIGTNFSALPVAAAIAKELRAAAPIGLAAPKALAKVER